MNNRPSIEPSLAETWKRTAERLQQILGSQAFKRWFEPLRPSHWDGSDCICLNGPSRLLCYWIEDNYRDLLKETLSAIASRPMNFRFICPDDNTKPAPISTPEVSQILSGKPQVPAEKNGLNPAFTFENFIVGPSNQYAHAGCWAVAQSPGRAYNPLFIYGGTGFGKTHLMNAIGHAVVAQNKSARVAYVSTERFVNEFIDAIQHKKFTPFRKKYRNCDILLIDDIHFLGRTDQMQEEFFHTFNTLSEAWKQVVLSSDRPVTEIANLEERLVTRFQSGLTVQIQPPDEETRVAILRKKQERSDVKVSDEVINFLAHHIKSNIRRLEGAWAKVWFSTKLKGRMLSLDEIQTELQDILIEEGKQALTTETIQKRVASYFDIRLADMTSKRKNANIVFPRQVAMYLCRTMTRNSLNEIGEAFGGKDHGTVLHAYRLVEKRLKADSSLKQAIAQLTKQLAH